MRQSVKLGGLLLALCTAGAQAQLYKWVGPDGKVTYSDTPPPASIKQVETKDIGDNSVSAAGLPFELAQAVKASPVTLYTTRNCAPCNEGRKHLTARGIPFTEKTVNSEEDIAQFRKVGGKEDLPLLIVGNVKERGFAAEAWNGTLTAAGYPETSMLPRSYRAPQAQAAAPEPKVASSGKTAASYPPPATELPPAIGNAPPGFRF